MGMEAANKDLAVVSGEMVIGEVSSGEVICGQAISGEVIKSETLNESSNSSSGTFFSFGGNDEHQTIMNYVSQKVQETFDHSTDSETEDDNPAE